MKTLNIFEETNKLFNLIKIELSKILHISTKNSVLLNFIESKIKKKLNVIELNCCSYFLCNYQKIIINENEYHGAFDNINMEPYGYGINIKNNGSINVGKYEKNQLNSLSLFLKPNCHFYIGNMKHHLSDGKGIFINREFIYKGCFSNGTMFGNGIKYKNGNKYYGNFYGENLISNAKICFANGDIYQGKVINDLPNGFGIMYFTQDDCNDYIYDGNFVGGLKHGYGKLYNNNGKILYSGSFFADTISGRGILYLKKQSLKCIYSNNLLIKIIDDNRHTKATIKN